MIVSRSHSARAVALEVFRINLRRNQSILFVSKTQNAVRTLSPTTHKYVANAYERVRKTMHTTHVHSLFTRFHIISLTHTHHIHTP
jgi:SpoU rRNA methylase family enzyme